MANINSLMSNSVSNTSSLYGTRNVLSGLASGMDTESMIENSVSGYKTKITQLQQQQTKYQWKQDAYRNITDKMYDLSQKYTSYTSKTNLYSNAFFNNSISTTAVSKDADAASKVSATGRSSSDIQIYAAKAATATRYDVSANALGLNVVNNVTKGLDLSGDPSVSDGKISVGKLNGSMTLNYDGQSIDITFDETDTGIGTTKTLAQAIEDKLKDVTINTKNGTQKASAVIKVGTENGKITFSENTDVSNQGANPYISYIDSSLKSSFGATESSLYEGSSTKKYTLSNVNSDFTDRVDVADYLSKKDISVTMDGVTKTFRLDKNLVSQGKIQEAFETGFQNIGMKVNITQDAITNELTFKPKNTTSNLSISAKDANVSKMLGLGDGLSNYLNTKTSIGALLGEGYNFTQTAETDTTITEHLEEDGSYWKDATTGNLYKEEGGQYYRVNDKGDDLYNLQINGKNVYITKDSSLESVLDAINSSDAGVTASYSKLTGKFVFTSKETGANSDITFNNDLAKNLFSAKTNTLRLGDVLGDEWFDADGNVTLRTTLTGEDGYQHYQGAFSKDTSVSDFLKAYNGSVTDNVAQFSDSSNPAGTAHNKNGDLTGYAESVTFDPTGTNTSVSKYYLKGSNNNQSMSLAEFAEKITGKTKGTDATVRATVNGEAVTLQRSSNDIEMDGMTVTLKGDINDITASDAVNKANAVSFSSSGGSDDLVKTITGFVDDYNALLKELYSAYSTQPAEKSSSTHAKYEPLTDDDKSGMSEKAIESYEAKAKQGILFGDSDLRAAYESMVRAITPGGNDGATLRNIGIETTYSGGVTQIKLNESKLREALEKDPDSVRNAFTKSKENGASSDGLMTSIKNTMEQYGSTSIANPGLLVKKAGNIHSSTSLLNNDMQKQLDNVQTQIERWQTKMSAKIDYYTRQFTALEKLMNTMNSQSSALSGLMGGY